MCKAELGKADFRSGLGTVRFGAQLGMVAAATKGLTTTRPHKL